MFGNYKLADLKNAPLSILVFLSLSGNRAVTVTDLAAETGFSEKPIRKGLKTLRDLGLITEPRKNRYQLTGKEYQLPLSWGERILEAGDSPEITGVLTGNTGVSPELERRVMLLEQAVFGNRDAEAGDSPEISGEFPLIESDKEESIEIVESPREEWSGNTPGKLGVFPVDGRNSQNTKVTGQWIEQERKGETPGKKGETSVDGRNSRNAAVTGQWVEKESAGETLEKTGEIPGITGDIPEGINPLINNLNINKVSKNVGKDIYLLNGMSDERKVNNPETQLGGQSPVPASRQQVTGPVLLPESEATELIHWKAAMEQMKTLMDRGSFTTMLKDAAVLGYEDGHYTIGVKNQMVRDWVDQRCRATIEKVLNGMSGNAGVVQSVSFVVSEVSETQLGGQSPVPASRQQVTGPVLLPESDDPEEGKLVEICNAYLLDPTGPEYSADQLGELVGMHPDPDVLRFVLPRLSGFEAVKGWCAADRKTAKRWLLTYFKIVGTAVDHLSKNDRVSFGLIVSVFMDQGIEDLSGVETKTANQMRGKAIWLIESMAKEVMPK